MTTVVTPPELERSIICALLHDASATFAGLHRLGFTDSHLYWYAHVVVVQLIREEWVEYRPITPVRLYDLLLRKGQLAELGTEPIMWIIDTWCMAYWFDDIFNWWCDWAEGEMPCVMLGLAAADKCKWLANRRALIYRALSAIKEAEDGSSDSDSFDSMF